MLEQLKERLRTQELLLVLDNFEHVVGAAPVVSELLDVCPRLTALVTSRTVLRLAREYVVEVPAMMAPDPQLVADLKTVAEYDAVRLFCERAQATHPKFTLTSANVKAVVEICRRLDGLPLAIELAAARARLFGPETLLARLSSRLGLLTGGARDSPTRHQTLRNAIAWSFELLTESERQLFERLAVFDGGCTLEAAEAVCNADQTLGIAVLDGVAALVDQSLLQRFEGESSEPRFGLLETIREYALERLEASGAAEAVRSRHAEHFLTLAEQAAPEFLGASQVQWVERLETEHDNVRAALRWCVEHGQFEQAMRFGGALWRFWQIRGYLREGRERLTELLGLSGPGTAASLQTLRPAVLFGAGYLARYQGDYAASRSFCEEGLALSRELGDRWWTAMSINNLATLAKYRGEYMLASSLYEESLAIRRELGDQWQIAETLNNMGILTKDRGDYDQARSLLQESLALKQARGDIWGMAMSLNKLGDVAFCEGDYTQARFLQEQSLAFYREIGDRWQIAETLNTLGNAALGQGDFAAARSACYESLEIKREVGDRRGIAMSLNSLGDVAEYDGDYSAARDLYEQSLSISRELGDGERIPESLEGLARVAAAERQAQRALRLVGAADKLRRDVGTPLSAGEQELLARRLEPARLTLTEEERQATWAEGQSMSAEQAVAYALESVDRL
jgi:predicted ATPase/Tfp pilus assembly protein PilF